MSLCHQVLHRERVIAHGAWHMCSQSWTYAQSSLRSSRVPKTRPLPVPVPSHVPALRQHILGVTPGLCFLGHPTPPGLTAWSPTPALPESAPGRFPRSVCPFSMTVGRYSTPCLTFRVDTISFSTLWPEEAIPLLGLPISRLAGSGLRRLRIFVEYPVHSHLLGAVTTFD
jgi:hypothetical protein